MRMLDFIEKKKSGQSLTQAEIEFLIQEYTADKIPDYQMAAFLMAVYFQGMTQEELSQFTMAMAKSGTMTDLSALGHISVDKHSTGGVGDKTTLVVAPIVAALGCSVAKMSGRGLGFTGGTIDKLESIPGFCSELSMQDFLFNAKNIGLCLAGQSGDSVPADKKIYALRDVTGTVDSIPLIASSIMSKKLAGGAQNIVLDVKVGNGAFMKDIETARELAKQMVSIGRNTGRNMCALLTNMNEPLGSMVGNALEVQEAVVVLKNKAADLKFKELCLQLSAYMVAISQKITIEESLEKVQQVLANGKAYDKFKAMVKQQGGDVSFIEDTAKLPKGQHHKDILAQESGYITQMDTQNIGIAASLLGAGRQEKGDILDLGAGFQIYYKTNAQIEKGEVIATAFADDIDKLNAGAEHYQASIQYGKYPVEEPPLVFEIIYGKNVENL